MSEFLTEQWQCAAQYSPLSSPFEAALPASATVHCATGDCSKVQREMQIHAALPALLALLPVLVPLLLLPLLHVQQEVSQPAHHRLAAGDDVPRSVPRNKALQGSSKRHTR